MEAKFSMKPGTRIPQCVKFTFLVLFIQFLISICILGRAAAGREGDMRDQLDLSRPDVKGKVSLEETLLRRESVRSFTPEPLSPGQISQLLWAGQGRTRPGGGRTAPSAGALYPLELYLATGDGVYHYRPDGHRLVRKSPDNVIGRLSEAALGQAAVRRAPAVIVIAAVPERTAGKYGERADRYIALEAGHTAQNILLQAVALGLGAVPIGAFYDAQVGKVLKLPPGESAIYIIAVGRPAK